MVQEDEFNTREGNDVQEPWVLKLSNDSDDDSSDHSAMGNHNRIDSLQIYFLILKLLVLYEQ
jgi:hypothetical protein